MGRARCGATLITPKFRGATCLRFFLKALREEGVEVDPKVERYDYGNFGWIMDPEGNRVELWEPPKNHS